MQGPKPRLKREALGELSPDDLGRVAGGFSQLPSCAPTMRTCGCGASDTCGCGATHDCPTWRCLTPAIASPPDIEPTFVIGLC